MDPISIKYELLTRIQHLQMMVLGVWKSNEITKKVDLDRSNVLSKVENIIGHYQEPPRATIITPTTGSPFLSRAIESVVTQSYGDVFHLIIVDGEQNLADAEKIIEQFGSPKVKKMVIPHNTGKGGMNGHRIYAAIPYLINSEFIFLLDQDNWLAPNHVSSMVNLMEKEDLDWVFSMRKVYTEDGYFVADDNCESLGDYESYSRLPNLVDTNCYGFRRSVLAKSAHYWYHPLRADRYFFHHLRKESPNYKCTGLYTVNYRLTKNRAPYPDFFLAGNQYMLNKYRGKLPWMNPD